MFLTNQNEFDGFQASNELDPRNCPLNLWQTWSVVCGFQKAVVVLEWCYCHILNLNESFEQWLQKTLIDRVNEKFLSVR